jgi:hypothetical protein
MLSKILTSTLLLCAACASQKATKKAPSHGDPLNQVSPPPQIQAQNIEGVPVLSPDASSATQAPGVDATVPTSTEPKLPKSFAVWIDGVGFESLAALGFLQELEKRGLKPVKVVGTGFGCWVAASWALSNNGNQAEWQAFKWAHFDALPKKGLLSRLTGAVGVQAKIEAQVTQLLPLKNLASASMPVDCPLLEASSPYSLRSGAGFAPPALIWHQLLSPGLGIQEGELLKDAWFSGALAGAPQALELEEFSRDIKRDAPGFGGWLVLRTRTSAERSSQNPLSQALASRADRSLPLSGQSPGQVAWVSVDLSGGVTRSSDDLRNPQLRRKWLLEGRKMGSQFATGDQVRTLTETHN